MSADSALSLRALTKTYPGPVQALAGVSLDVAPRELLALVGPSGCGKSTLLRLVAGLDTPSSGEVWIGGARADHLSPRERDVAVVFQSHSLFPHLSAFDNMAYGLRLRGRPGPEIAARVRDAARTLGVEALLDRRPSALSGGERQRIALGRALVRRPRLLLLDEPLSSLDAHLRADLRREIVRLHRRLETITLLVTHDQAEALSVADRVAVLDRGVLQQVATPGELLARPANRFVAGFIGVPATTFFEGTLDAEQGRPRFRHAAFTLDVAERWWPVLASPPGRAVVLGVRPEQWTAVEDERGAANGVVDWVENLGDRAFAHVRLEGTLAVVRWADGRQPPAVGSTLRLKPRPEAVLFFDPASGRALEP